MYSSIVWNPASLLAFNAEVYVHSPSGFLRRSLPASRIATWSWKPPRALTMQGLTTQVSDPKRNTACTTDLKKNPDTRVSAPYLLSIIVILFNTALSRDNLLTTAGQLSSADEINRPRYQKEVTISRGRP